MKTVTVTKSIGAALVALLALFARGAVGTAVAATCEGTRGPSGTVEIKMGAITRTFVVRLPAAYDGRSPAPVVFAFHPFGMNPQYMQGRVPIPREWPEAIAVYPAGLPRPGGSFQPAWQGKPGEMDDRDLLFFDTMLDWLRLNHCFDEKRIFVLGYSNGAHFSSVLACERAGVIAGFAFASGSLDCTPREARPVIFSHGLRDSTIPYDRAVEAASAWTMRNECRIPPRSGGTGCVAAASCSAAPVVLCSYDGGHEYNEPFTRAAVEFFKATRLK